MTERQHRALAIEHAARARDMAMAGVHVEALRSAGRSLWHAVLAWMESP